MINKEDIIGKNKNLFWFDKNQKLTYKFLKDGSGLLINADNKKIGFNWELISRNNNQVIKINHNGFLSYYIFNEKNNDNSYSVTYKTKENEIKSSLIQRLVKKELKDDRKEEIKKDVNNHNLNEKNEVNKSIENTDKIFFLFALFIPTIFITFLIKSTEMFSQLSFSTVFLISLVASIIIVFYLREPLIYISRKYKKEINDIIIGIISKFKK